MDSYGELLRKTREEQVLDFETISRETTISASYLKGLEDEDNSAFPGEAYMLGFMRNYAEFLGLNPQTVLALYRGKKLQESPVPEGLIVQEKPKYYKPLIIASIIFVLIIAGIVTGILVSKNTDKKSNTVAIDKSFAHKQYELSDKALKERLYIGDQLLVPFESGNIILTVSDTLSSFGLQCPVGTLYTELAEEANLDIDGDTQTDLIVYVSDISLSDASRGAEVRILKRNGGAFVAQVNQADIPFANEIQSNHKQLVILEDTRAYPFTLNGSFRGSCVFRYKVDRQNANESYFASGEIVTMTANNGIRLWMSNCNTIKFSIIADSKSYDLEIGKAGQVLAEDIKWIKDTDGKYKLVVIELD